MIIRVQDPVRINEIFNIPEIRAAFDAPSIAGKPLDFTDFVANPGNIALLGEHGCCLFRRHQLGIYECHFAVVPEYRGEWTLEFGWSAFQYLFCETDAVEIMTKCKADDVAANAGCRMIKFQKMFTTRPFCESQDGPVAMNAYSMTIQYWATIAPGLEEAGEEWHRIIHALHDEDAVHNRYAGIALLMIRGGQAMKAATFYNRSAVMSGYRPVKVLSLNPLVIDIVDAKIRITGRDFEVIE